METLSDMHTVYANVMLNVHRTSTCYRDVLDFAPYLKQMKQIKKLNATFHRNAYAK